MPFARLPLPMVWAALRGELGELPDLLSACKVRIERVWKRTRHTGLFLRLPVTHEVVRVLAVGIKLDNNLG
jgi:hypothetical protein